MAWIESHQTLGTHRKLLALCQALHIEDTRAVGMLHYLWWWALDNAPDPAIEVVRIVIPEKLRNRIYERDNYHCVLCGSPSDLQLDHIIPFSKGGRTE